jgi:hypothetical protein
MEISTVQMILFAFHYLFSLLVLLLVFVLLRRLFLLLIKPLKQTQTSSLNLFLSFGITLLFFRSTFLGAITKIGNFFLFPFHYTEIIGESMNRYSAGEFTQPFVNYLFAWSSAMGQNINHNILQLNFSGLIILLVFWLLFSLLINEVSKNIKIQNTNNGALITSFFDKPIVKNFLTLLLVLFSIYLSIASIIAVPEFQTLESSTPDPEMIKSLETDIADQRLSKKEDLLIDIEPDSNRNYLLEEYKTISLELNHTLMSHNNWVEGNWLNDEKIQKAVVTHFKSAIEQKMSPKDQWRYKQRLNAWYLNENEQWILGVNTFKMQLHSVKEKILQYVDSEQDIKYDTLQNVNDSTFILQPTLNNYGKGVIDGFSTTLRIFDKRYSSLFDSEFNISEIPRKPAVGEKFGFFNLISGWLLKTESLSLAIIVGLFGFGLLGSVGSLFIRSRLSTGKSSEPVIVSDIPGILMNGMSAAIVIFLAVKGAVIIFSTDGDNLNPYVIFFTCLIASVFSEDVWTWARKKLNENLNTEPTTELTTPETSSSEEQPNQ